SSATVKTSSRSSPEAERDPRRRRIGLGRSVAIGESDPTDRICFVAGTVTKHAFDEQALAALPASTPFIDGLRKQAFDEFLALPIPSQETEEWRYTDVSELDLGLAPSTPGGRA